MRIEVNIHHTCTSLVEFSELSTALQALLAKFSSAAPAAVVPAPQLPPVLRDVAAVDAPPTSAPVERTGVVGAALENQTDPEPVRFTHEVTPEMAPAAARVVDLGEVQKRKRRTKAEIAAARAADTAKVVAQTIPAPAPVKTSAPAPVDIFGDEQKPATPPSLENADKQTLMGFAQRIFEHDGSEAGFALIMNKYGGSILNVAADKIGPCAAELNGLLRELESGK